MIKTLMKQLKEYRNDAVITPCFMILEVMMEMIIPLFMGYIVDNGVTNGDIHYIYKMGFFMIIAAIVSLTAGILGGKHAARASAGFAKNLRQSMYENIQTFSFANIDRFSTAGLVTRMTTDITNIQNAFQMMLRMCVRAFFSLICAMGLSFFISPRLATIYLGAVFVLGTILAIIVSLAMKYFGQTFPKYDDLNESVQENVLAIRVVKAFVREDYEKKRFTKASGNLYNMFVKA